MKMKQTSVKKAKSKRGGAMVEFALTLPLLLMLCMGATDFGRLFYHAVVVANSAYVGSFHGAQRFSTAGQFPIMELKAEEEAANIIAGNLIADFSAESDKVCDCPDSPAFIDSSGQLQNTIDCDLFSTCPGYGTRRAYIRTKARQTFAVFGPYPGIPETTRVGRDVLLRVK